MASRYLHPTILFRAPEIINTKRPFRGPAKLSVNRGLAKLLRDYLLPYNMLLSQREDCALTLCHGHESAHATGTTHVVRVCQPLSISRPSLSEHQQSENVYLTGPSVPAVDVAWPTWHSSSVTQEPFCISRHCFTQSTNIFLQTCATL